MVKDFLTNGKNLFFRRQAGILSAAAVIMVAYGLSGILGLVRNRLLAARFFSGQEAQLDAYFAAFVLPDTIFQLLILGALSAAFIPVFSSYLHRDQKEAWQVANASMSFIVLLFSLLSAALFIFALPASRLLAFHFSDDLVHLTASLTRIMLIAQFFFALSAFMTGVLQSFHRFLLPALAPLVYNLGIILGIIFLSPFLGIYGPAVGVVIGSIFHFLIQLPLARKLGFRFRISSDFFHPGVVRIRRMMAPRALTLALGQLERVLAVLFTSSLAAGTLTIFNFARQLYILPINLFGATLGQAAFPSLSGEHERGKDFYVEIIVNTILQIAFFTFPAAALLLVLRIPIVRLAFGARQFPWPATLLTGRTLAILAFAIPAQSINQLLTRAFYAAHNTRLPFYISLINTLFLLLLAPLLVTKLGWGVLGFAAAIMISDISNMLFLIFKLQAFSAPSLLKKLFPPFAKILFVTALTSIFLWIPMKILDKFVFDTTRTIPLIALTVTAGIIGFIVYLTLSYFLKIKQLDMVFQLIKRLGNWRKILKSSDEVLEPVNVNV